MLQHPPLFHTVRSSSKGSSSFISTNVKRNANEFAFCRQQANNEFQFAHVKDDFIINRNNRPPNILLVLVIRMTGIHAHFKCDQPSCYLEFRLQASSILHAHQASICDSPVCMCWIYYGSLRGNSATARAVPGLLYSLI